MHSLRTKVRKWGNSLGLRLPKGAAEEAGIADGSSVEIRVEGDSLIVRPVETRRFQLSALLSGVTKGNLHSETDFGEPEGKESL